MDAKPATIEEYLATVPEEFRAALEALRQQIRALVADQGPEQGERLHAYFTKARDARADWATAERTDGQLAQETEAELSKTALTNQFGQMLFGGLARRRLESGAEPKRRERADRK